MCCHFVVKQGQEKMKIGMVTNFEATKNVGFLLCILLLTKGFFYCQRNLWFGAHIDTGVIGFLNDPGCIFSRICITLPTKVAL